MSDDCIGCNPDHQSGFLCNPCRELLELGQWVAAKQAEYEAKNKKREISDWQMEILNWLDGAPIATRADKKGGA